MVAYRDLFVRFCKMRYIRDGQPFQPDDVERELAYTLKVSGIEIEDCAATPELWTELADDARKAREGDNVALNHFHCAVDSTTVAAMAVAAMADEIERLREIVGRLIAKDEDGTP